MDLQSGYSLSISITSFVISYLKLHHFMYTVVPLCPQYWHKLEPVFGYTWVLLAVRFVSPMKAKCLFCKNMQSCLNLCTHSLFFCGSHPNFSRTLHCRGAHIFSPFQGQGWGDHTAKMRWPSCYALISRYMYSQVILYCLCLTYRKGAFRVVKISWATGTFHRLFWILHRLLQMSVQL